ncbi:GntR family transcriptional regulator [Planctomicrobium sp. SH664]|uniref:GntR family transcriptional regulator n=1 Tax=Planctomicrobium sp. SH664 TaxID=3448125 RepID=UPI003F5C4E32
MKAKPTRSRSKADEPVPALTKARSIFCDLRSRILSGEIPASARLTLRPLARGYGAGNHAVSEAVKALAAEGLVESEGRAGVRGIARDLGRIRSEFILRIALESETARRCAEVVDGGQLLVLEEMARKVDQLFRDGVQLAKCRDADVRFHLAIAEFSGVPLLKDLLVPLVDRLVMLDQTESRTREIPGQKHIEVFEAIETRKPEIAAEIMRKHLEHSMNLSLAMLFR